MFVSDALPKDVFTAMAALGSLGGTGAAVAACLRAALRGEESEDAVAPTRLGQLRLWSHWYYTSPLEAVDMPASVRASWVAGAVVVVKGDANYRRITGDRHWATTASLDNDVAPWCPAPTILLRTLKSDSLAGLTLAEAEAGAKFGGDWRVSGKCGVVQIVGGSSTQAC